MASKGTRSLIGPIIAIALALMVVLFVLLALSGFGDVPCQDGVWDARKKTCVPT